MLMSSQHGPLIRRSRMNISRAELFVPNTWQNVSPARSAGKAGNSDEYLTSRYSLSNGISFSPKAYDRVTFIDLNFIILYRSAMQSLNSCIKLYSNTASKSTENHNTGINTTCLQFQSNSHYLAKKYNQLFAKNTIL